MVARTQQEILDRFNAVMSMFGFEREVLAEAMDAASLAQVGIDVEKIDGWSQLSADDIEASAADYLVFAIGKIEDHRGISAGRSVTKLREYAWLLGRDDVVAAMDEADYAQYGAPMVKAFAVGMGWPWPDGSIADVMATGEPCRPDCEEGCGL